MRQMRLKRRPHVHQELLELGVRSVGDQDLVQRVDYGRVVRHLTVDIGLVERLALERLDRRASLGRTLEERLTDRVVLRRDAELRGDRGCLRVDRAVRLAVTATWATSGSASLGEAAWACRPAGSARARDSANRG